MVRALAVDVVDGDAGLGVGALATGVAGLEIMQSARTRQKTPQWEKSYDERAGIEGTFSRATSVLGLRSRGT